MDLTPLLWWIPLAIAGILGSLLVAWILVAYVGVGAVGLGRRLLRRDRPHQ